MIEGRVGRRWVQIFGIPVMPLDDAPKRFSACQECGGVIPREIEQVRRRAAGGVGRQRQVAIEVYNELRERPGDSAVLFKLLELYGLMGEYHEAVVTAKLFPEALNASPDCLELLSRLEAMGRAEVERVAQGEGSVGLCRRARARGMAEAGGIVGRCPKGGLDAGRYQRGAGLRAYAADRGDSFRV
jgi:hypothetical protein